MFKNRRMILAIICSVVFIIILILILALITSNKSKKVENIDKSVTVDKSKLEMNFKNSIDNKENEYVKTLYSIKEEDSGKYDIVAEVPYISVSPEIDGKINKEINDIFVKTILDVYNGSEQNTRLEIGYTSSINKDVLSTMIKCTLKKGANPQRTIIKTYNFT